MPTARHTILSETAPQNDDGEWHVVIETPNGSRNKYSYDPDCDCMQLSTVLPEGMVFLYDFGFIPSTLGQDGDPLDMLILMEAPVVPGCVVRARLIGALEAEQKGKWELDSERPSDRRRGARADLPAAKSLADLRPHHDYIAACGGRPCRRQRPI